MKRVFVICLSAVLALAALTGCRGGEVTDPTAPIVSASPSPATDNGGVSGMMDDAGDAVRNAGHAVNDAAENALRGTASPAVSPSVNTAK